MSETNPKAPEGAIAIAEKWREVRRQCIEFLARPGEPSAKPIEWCVQLIDDLTSLTQRAELAESRVKELKQVETDHEYIPCACEDCFGSKKARCAECHEDADARNHAHEFENVPDYIEPEKSTCNRCGNAIGRLEGADWMHEDGTVLCDGKLISPRVASAAPDSAPVGGKEGER